MEPKKEKEEKMNLVERKLRDIRGLLEAFYMEGKDTIPVERIQTILDLEPELFDQEEEKEMKP